LAQLLHEFLTQRRKGAKSAEVKKKKDYFIPFFLLFSVSWRLGVKKIKKIKVLAWFLLIYKCWQRKPEPGSLKSCQFMGMGLKAA